VHADRVRGWSVFDSENNQIRSFDAERLQVWQQATDRVAEKAQPISMVPWPHLQVCLVNIIDACSMLDIAFSPGKPLAPYLKHGGPRTMAYPFQTDGMQK
jgi:hypothetical protein